MPAGPAPANAGGVDIVGAGPARGIAQLGDSLQRFNRRWVEYARALDLRPINALRADYNRYYLLEKECAVRSPMIARQGYQPLEPLTVEAILAVLPPLPVPGPPC